jgi:acetyl/propionyl-CoA carboxylase alpha subunit
MMTVAATPVSNTVNAVGALITEDSVVLRPEIDGRIDKLLFKEGQPVKKGALLVVLDSAEQRATAELGGRTSAILLPEQAIVPRPDGSYVFWRSTARPNCAVSRWANVNRVGSRSSPA